MTATSLGLHESADLAELIMSCTNSINSMGLFISQAKDPTLKQMLERHMPFHIQDYNMKLEWITQGSSPDRLNVPPMPGRHTGTAPQAQAVTPNPQTAALDDRAIATSYLLTLKRAGRDYAWAAMECCDPKLRAFLEDAFTMCSHQALEVWNWMYAKGWYPAETAPSTYTQKVSQSFHQVPESAYVQ